MYLQIKLKIKIMENNILSITKKLPIVATLPNGFYKGIWGGDVIELTYENIVYQLKTEEGIRGIGIEVVVQIEDERAIFRTIKNK